MGEYILHPKLAEQPHADQLAIKIGVCRGENFYRLGNAVHHQSLMMLRRLGYRDFCAGE